MRGLVVLLAILLEPASTPNTGGPRLGAPCRLVQQHPVTFTTDATGTWVASFAFAGGAARGHLALPGVDGGTVGQRRAYVADVRLGSYEPADAGDQSRMVCRLASTYHFYCPATGVVDQLCLTWADQPARPRTS